MYEDSLKDISDRILELKKVRCYYDYDDAIRASKKYKKPVLLFFNAINTISCRVLERKVLDQPEVENYLSEHFIVTHLFCDYRQIEFPVANYPIDTQSRNPFINPIGLKNNTIQTEKFNSNTQPTIFFIDEQERPLANGGYSYNPDVNKFMKHVHQVVDKYNTLHLLN